MKNILKIVFLIVVVCTLAQVRIVNAQELAGAHEKACVNLVIDEETAKVTCKGEGEMCTKIKQCLKTDKKEQ